MHPQDPPPPHHSQDLSNGEEADLLERFLATMGGKLPPNTHTV